MSCGLGDSLFTTLLSTCRRGAEEPVHFARMRRENPWTSTCREPVGEFRKGVQRVRIKDQRSRYLGIKRAHQLAQFVAPPQPGPARPGGGPASQLGQRIPRGKRQTTMGITRKGNGHVTCMHRRHGFQARIRNRQRDQSSAAVKRPRPVSTMAPLIPREPPINNARP